MTIQPTLEDDEPFRPDAVEPAGSRIPRPVLLGCGCLVIVIGIILVALLFKGEEIARWGLGWSLERLEAGVAEALPVDLPAARRRRLEAAFASAREQVAQGELDPAALTDLQETLPGISRAMGEQDSLTLDQVEKLTTALEEFGGSSAPSTRDSTPATSNSPPATRESEPASSPVPSPELQASSP